MEEAVFLVTVYHIIGRIKVQDQFLRRCFKRSNELLDDDFMHAPSSFSVGPVLPAAQGRTAGQFLGAPQCRLDGQVQAHS